MPMGKYDEERMIAIIQFPTIPRIQNHPFNLMTANMDNMIVASLEGAGER